MGIGQRDGRPHVRKPVDETIEQRAQLAGRTRPARQCATRLPACCPSRRRDRRSRRSHQESARRARGTARRFRSATGGRCCVEAGVRQDASRAHRPAGSPSPSTRAAGSPPGESRLPCHRHECPNRLKLVHLSGFPARSTALTRTSVAASRPTCNGPPTRLHRHQPRRVGRHARARREPACNGRKPASAGPMHDYSNSSPESFPVVRCGNAGGIPGHATVIPVSPECTGSRLFQQVQWYENGRKMACPILRLFCLNFRICALHTAQ